MDAPSMLEPRQVAPDTISLTSYFPLPGLGVLPVNAFVVRSRQPMLVDTGLACLRGPFLDALRSVIDPEALKWIWLTHTDADHIGNLAAVAKEAPNARIITTYLGLGKMGLLELPIPPERTWLLNPGQSLDLGDRRITAVKPPSYDAPETTGFIDERTRVLFSADAFGALMHEPAEEVSDIPPARLRDGMLTWATVDAPWLNITDAGRFAARLDLLRQLDPAVILSGHLPPAPGHVRETLFGHLDEARQAPLFEGPDQAMVEQMMARG
jgi:glyoxylase-like metal-dependent hydrolase (beta-lactamase superfamily II)